MQDLRELVYYLLQRYQTDMSCRPFALGQRTQMRQTMNGLDIVPQPDAPMVNRWLQDHLALLSGLVWY